MTINNNNIFGAFTLNEARGSRLTGDWLNKESVANYGWFGGGSPTVATVDRIDFSNDSQSLSIRGPLSSARSNLSATGNSNYGWFGGGNPGPVATVDRIDFSNDLATASPRGPLSLVRQGLAATGNSNYGWFGGGGPGVSRVDRIDFSNDSATASIRGPLSSARYRLAATGNSNYGWFGGGNPGPVATVDRIDFSNDLATASPRGPLSLVRQGLAATGNSNYGWFGGGGPGVSRVDRIDFSNDSATASIRGPLSSARYRLAATGNSNYGWFGGGATPTTVATVNRIDFSNDSSTASPRGPLSAARYALAATSGVLNIRRQKAGNYGWFGGGILFPSTLATVNRIDFSNDSTSASPRSPLSLARHGLAATGNSNYGWFGGGRLPGSPQPTQYSTVDRIDFSNDSSTASPRGPLSLSTKYLHGATGNSNYGWFGGGVNSSFSSVATVDRIDFSNDSSTALQRGPLSSANSEITATGNSNYGWFGVGFPEIVDRIDFSNDSSTALQRGSIPYRYTVAATGNSNYGWFGGGANPSAPFTKSTVNRIDFSNDSSTASPRGPLSQARQSLAATGNSNYGWFGGGWFSPSTPQINYSIVDRIDFSNDSVTAVARSLLTGARYAMGATSNTPIG